ncbi:Cupredoxin [Lipomyces kononenkoae]
MKLLQCLHLLVCIGSAFAFTVHDVAVGQGGLTYNPSSVTAAVGDYVRFTFFTGPHGVAQAAFDSPCVPLASPSSGDNDVFFSGIQTPSGSTNPTFIIKVNSTDPLFFYCPVDSHCQFGMVGVINPTGSESVSAFASAASSVSSSSQPSQPAGNVPIESSSSSTSPSSTSTSMTPSSSSNVTMSVTAMSSSTSPPKSTSTMTSSGASTGAISICAALIAGLLAFARMLFA